MKGVNQLLGHLHKLPGKYTSILPRNASKYGSILTRNTLDTGCDLVKQLEA